MQAKVKKKMQQDPPKISVQFHTVCARLAADFHRLLCLYFALCSWWLVGSKQQSTK
jgi:hypothetical protein